MFWGSGDISLRCGVAAAGLSCILACPLRGLYEKGVTVEMAGRCRVWPRELAQMGACVEACPYGGGDPADPETMGG